MSTATLRLRSAIPGRERWEMRSLRGQVRQCAALELLLKQELSVQHVSVNPGTGRILVLYDVARPVPRADRERLLSRALSALQAYGADDPLSSSRAHITVRLLDAVPQTAGLLVRAAVLSVVNVFFYVLAPVAYIAMMVTVQQNGSAFLRSLGILTLRTQMWLLFFVTLVAMTAELVSEHVQRSHWHRAAAELEHALRIRTFSHVQRLDQVFFDDQSTGRLISIIVADSSELFHFLERDADNLIRTATVFVIMAVALLGASPAMMLLAFIPLAFVVLTSAYFRAAHAPYYERVRSSEADLSHVLETSLSGMTMLKSFTAEDYQSERVTTISRRARDRSEEAARTTWTFSNLLEGQFSFSVAATTLAGALLVMEEKLTFGYYFFSYAVMRQLLIMTERLNESYAAYMRAVASGERILELLRATPQITGGARRLQRDRVAGEIHFDRVSFGYRSESPVLNDFNLHIQPGEHLGVVGATGVGKTTIVKLLMRLYDTDRGRILIDGVDVRDLRLEDVRKAISYVSQDTPILHGTIYENISYGNPSASPEEVREAARIAVAHDFIMSLPSAFDTMVGERGQKLSAGQRQRVAIARAVLKNAPILLFDEATSNVDNETHAAIQRAISALSVGRTTIMITHRLATLRRASRIAVVNAGQVSQIGTHSQLLEQKGLYSVLWQKEIGD